MSTQSALQYSLPFTHSHTHSYSASISSTFFSMRGNSGVQHLAQGHFALHPSATAAPTWYYIMYSLQLFTPHLFLSLRSTRPTITCTKCTHTRTHTRRHTYFISNPSLPHSYCFVLSVCNLLLYLFLYVWSILFVALSVTVLTNKNEMT